VTETKPMIVSFLLDETGSMAFPPGNREETIGGFNTYVETLADSETADRTTLSVVKFNTSKTEKWLAHTPVKDAPKLTLETYVPGSQTPLIDAAFKLIMATRAHVEGRDDKPNVVVVMLTDGAENASREHTMDQLNALIKEMSGQGWQFVFLGADIDAFGVAGQMGISRNTTATFDKGATPEVFAQMGAQTRSYGATGMSANLHFSDRTRGVFMGVNPRDSGPKVTPPHQPAPTKPRAKSLVDDIEL